MHGIERHGFECSAASVPVFELLSEAGLAESSPPSKPKAEEQRQLADAMQAIVYAVS